LSIKTGRTLGRRYYVTRTAHTTIVDCLGFQVRLKKTSFLLVLLNIWKSIKVIALTSGEWVGEKKEEEGRNSERGDVKVGSQQ